MNKKRNRISAFLCLLILAAMVLSSCKSGGSDKRGIKIYYLNNEGTGLDDQAYTPKGDTTEEIITELIGKLSAPPKDLSLLAPISGFSLVYSAYRDGVITLDMSQEYYDLPVVTEILTRTAIVNTL